ncbi:unnamed protein product, partial [Rotaria sp. Silwood1]
IRMTGVKYIRFRGAFGSEQNKIIELSNTILATLSPQTLHDHDSYPLHSSHHVVSLPSQPSSPPQQQQQHQQHLSSTNSIQQISIVTLRPFNQWTSTGDDINQWFAYHRLSNKLRDLYDFQTGEEMREYAKILVKDREKQIHIYERLFSKKYNDKINYRDLTESRILVFSSDISDENDPPISSESNWNSDDDVYSTDDNKHRGEETLTRSKNLRTYNRWDQTNHVNKQPAIIDTTTSSSDELPEIPNSPAPNQRVFKSAKV